MKLWNLYVTDEHFDRNYFIPFKISNELYMLKSSQGKRFKVITGTNDPVYWPNNEIVYSGKHTEEVIKTLFKYGISE